jgi:hypothetical protein
MGAILPTRAQQSLRKSRRKLQGREKLLLVSRVPTRSTISQAALLADERLERFCKVTEIDGGGAEPVSEEEVRAVVNRSLRSIIVFSITATRGHRRFIFAILTRLKAFEP